MRVLREGLIELKMVFWRKFEVNGQYIYHIGLKISTRVLICLRHDQSAYFLSSSLSFRQLSLNFIHSIDEINGMKGYRKLILKNQRVKIWFIFGIEIFRKEAFLRKELIKGMGTMEFNIHCLYMWQDFCDRIRINSNYLN